MKAILKFVGGKHWPWPQDHVTETRLRGPSVRVAPDSVPDLFAPYPVLFVHPRGTLSVTRMGVFLDDLFTELVMEGHVSPCAARDRFILDGLPTLELVGVFRGLDMFKKEEFVRLVEKYGIEFKPAVTHYSYITGTQVVIGDDGEGLDRVKELADRGIVAEPVRVVRVEEGEDVSSH